LLPAPPVAEAAPNCEGERGLLNQRLWFLRGVYVDVASANVLTDSEAPLRPSAYGFIPGYGPGLASVLPAAASSDTPTRDLLAEYSACLERGGR
jgi:hypothetical protein